MRILEERSLALTVSDLDANQFGQQRVRVLLRELTPDAVDAEEIKTYVLPAEGRLAELFPDFGPYKAGHVWAARRACREFGYFGDLMPAYFGESTLFVGVDAQADKPDATPPEAAAIFAVIGSKCPTGARGIYRDALYPALWHATANAMGNWAGRFIVKENGNADESPSPDFFHCENVEIDGRWFTVWKEKAED